MWASYYQLLLAQQDVHPRRLLDVCCGTGIVTEILAKEGYQLTGIDLSEPMIAEAKRKAIEAGLNIRYEATDAAEFELHQKFDAAYSFFDSLNYITDLGQLRKAIHRVSKHLLPGGSFIFDLNTSYAFESKMFDQQDTRPRTRVKYNWVGDYNPSSRIIEVAMEFWVEGEKLTETHIQRAHRPEEIEEMLLEAGFVELRCLDSYTLNPPRKKSDRVHWCALLPER
jgi:2-polyprenyl-3-methyl-5-hydroxy-6-metoxy-1,4-benzoquinol methylase